MKALPLRPTALILTLTVCAAALTGAGCMRRASLEPAPGARTTPALEDGAVASVDGVRVTVQANAWPGEESVHEYVTPLQLRLRNGSNHPVRIRYEEFNAVAADGTRYASLPPHEVEGTIEEPLVATGVTAVDTPLFYHDHFYVAPYYSTLYPTITPYAGTFYHDPIYFDHYSRVWIDYPLPTARMLRRALPAGVVQPGGEVAGFLYLERIDPQDRRVHFRADLVNAETGEMFGEISVPFTVDEGPPTTASR